MPATQRKCIYRGLTLDVDHTEPKQAITNVFEKMYHHLTFSISFDIIGYPSGLSYLSKMFGNKLLCTWLLPGTWSQLWFAGVRECPPWCSIVGTTVTVHQFFCILPVIEELIVLYLYLTGLSYLSKMCGNYSVSVIEEKRNALSVHVAAHELGHK